MDYEDDIIKSVEVLKTGGTLLYPTDTVWGLGCDATNPDAVDKIYKIKRRIASKSLIILIDRFEVLPNYVERVPEITYDLLSSIENPVTIIYSNAQNLAHNVIAMDGTIAIRIVRDQFCSEIIRRFGKPIVSTSANVSGEATPMRFSQISEELKDEVDYVVKYHQEHYAQYRPSTIIRLFEDGDYSVIRD